MVVGRFVVGVPLVNNAPCAWFLAGWFLGRLFLGGWFVVLGSWWLVPCWVVPWWLVPWWFVPCWLLVGGGYLHTLNLVPLLVGVPLVNNAPCAWFVVLGSLVGCSLVVGSLELVPCWLVVVTCIP